MDVRWMNSNTGEIKVRQGSGVDHEFYPDGTPCSNKWELSPLELALALVPDIVEAITIAHAKGEGLTVSVQSDPMLDGIPVRRAILA